MNDPSEIAIGANHRRGIGSALILMDEMLSRFDLWIDGAGADGLLYREDNDLDADQRSRIRAEIVAARRLLEMLRERLRIDPEVRSVSKLIWAQASWFWETLAELESRHLLRYGKLPPGFADFFDPQVKLLAERLDAISQLAKSRSRREAPAPEQPRGQADSAGATGKRDE